MTGHRAPIRWTERALYLAEYLMALGVIAALVVVLVVMVAR